jgi:FixJ family two-component response regulator
MSSATPIYVAVVDDDENLCRSLGRLLRAAKIHPVTYSSAEAFLEDTKHPQFDCLVLDIQLGGMSGIELQRRLVAVGGKTPVIFITAKDDAEIRAEAEVVGCAAFFRKTAPGTVVIETIRRLAARKRTP